MGTLVLLRHGQSMWNAENLFTGWVDVPLSETGEQEARRGGELLREASLLPDVVHTSVLRRAISHREPGPRRLRPALDPGAPRLAAQRAALRRAAGQEQEADPGAVRRGAVHALAPLLRRAAAGRSSPDSEFSQDGDPRYAGLGARDAAAPSAWPTWSTASCRTGSRPSCPTCGPARSCCWPRTATRCGRWSSTWTGSPTTDIAGPEHPDRHPAALRARRRPAADRARRGSYLDPEAAADGRRRGGRPGALSAHPSVRRVNRG